MMCIESGCFHRDNNNMNPDIDRAESKRLFNEAKRVLREEEKKHQKTTKVLILGCGEAGKSTFIKQLKVISAEDGKEDAFSAEDKKVCRQNMAANVTSATLTLHENIKEANREDFFSDSDFQTTISTLYKLWKDSDVQDEGSQSKKPINPDEVFKLADTIKRIWDHPAIQEAFSRSSTYQLVTSAKYLMPRVQEVLNPMHEITKQDILETRVKTTAVQFYDREMDWDKKQYNIQFIDVGGQRQYRSQWERILTDYFDNIFLLIYIVAVSEFDQVLEEEDTVNRIQESENLFQGLFEDRNFRDRLRRAPLKDKPVIVFFNKVDLLEEKIKKGVDVTEHIEELAQKPGSEKFSEPLPKDNQMEFDRMVKERKDAVIGHFREKFRSLYKPGSNKKADESFYTFETCATDTESIKKIEGALKEKLFKELLSGLLI